MRRRKVPVRTCIACRRSGDKRNFVRVVRVPAGGVVVDRTGKLSGRGAYLCRTLECVHRAVKGKRLSRSLRAEVPEETLRELERIVEQGSAEM